MLQLENDTPFCANMTLLADERGVDHVVLTVKATFVVGQGVTVAERQDDLVEADVYWGETGRSSLKYASEIHLPKPATDIVAVGEACAPDETPVTHLVVAVAVADRLKTIRVFGDRYWESGLVGLSASAPRPFVRMPLVYERAFGGTVESDNGSGRSFVESRNPVGAGLNAGRKKAEIKGRPLPNLEHPRQRIRHPGDTSAPACFGFVAPSWMPRRKYAGTYDEGWVKRRAPFLPDDFDARFFNAAHPDLTCRGFLKGGEPVNVLNMCPGGALRFQLPVCDMDARVTIAGRTSAMPLTIETLLLEPGRSRFALLWRGKAPCDKRSLQVEEVRLTVNRLKF